jgi:hypothetical protein
MIPRSLIAIGLGCLIPTAAVWRAAARAAETAAEAITPTTSKPLRLRQRSRLETPPGSGRFQVAATEDQWDPTRTAIIVCDMWDAHWCR